MYKIKLAEPEHFTLIYEIYKPFVIDTPISFETEPPTFEAFANRIQLTMKIYPWLVCCFDEEVAGFASASRHRQRDAYKWSVEVSIYVKQVFRNRKVATGLYTSLLEILKLQNFKNALAGISLPNEISVAFHESLGFKQIAEYENIGYKLGKWHNTGWWQKPLNVYLDNPENPVSLDQITQHQINQALKKGENRILT
jgi:phosphinothricin acetyltransferase